MMTHCPKPPSLRRDILIPLLLFCSCLALRAQQVVPPDLASKLLAATTIAQVTPQVRLAAKQYRPLLKAGQLTEAQKLTTLVQQTLVRIGYADDLSIADHRAYYEALALENPHEYLVEGMGFFIDLPRFLSVSRASYPHELACALYAPLMKAGYTERAHELYAKMRAKLAELQETNGWSAAETKAYLDPLEKADPHQFLIQAQLYLKTIDDTTPPDELKSAAGLAQRLYAPLLAAEHADDATALCRRIETLLLRAGAGSESVLADRMAYLTALEHAAPAAFLTAALETFNSLKGAANAAELPTLLDLAQRLYTPLIEAKRAKEAAAIFNAVQAAVLQSGAARSALDANARFYLSVLAGADTALYLSEATAYIAGRQNVAVAADLRYPAELAAQLYAPLLRAGKGADALAVHNQLQAQYTALGAQDVPRQADALAYYDALSTADALGNLDKLSPVVLEAGDAATFDLPVLVASRLYTPLLQAKRIADAQAIHQALAAALTKANNTKLARQDLVAYHTALLAAVEQFALATTATADERAPWIAACQSLWSDNAAALADRVQTFVQLQLADHASAAEWMPAYAALLAHLPADNPARPLLLIWTGTWAHRLALQAKDHAQANAFYTLGEGADLSLITDYPAHAGVTKAIADLVLMYEEREQSEELAKIIGRLDEKTTAIAPTAWLADYYFLAADDGFRLALPIYRRLLENAPTNPRCPVWLYRVARCQEEVGDNDAAIATYQRIIDTYPDSSVVVAAGRKLDAAKGGK